MKTIIRAIIITFVLMCGIANAKADNTYTINTTVINVENDIISCEDSNGNVWEFYGEGYKVNDMLILVMDSNHTEMIYDYMVIDVQN